MQKLRDDRAFLSTYYKKGDCFESLLSRATYLTHYSRNETWTDTILRVVDGNCDLDPNVSLEERRKLFHFFWTMQGLPPGRGLWVGGVPNIPSDASQNCWATTIYDTDEWGWVANQLMLGGGVGVNLMHLDSLPSVALGASTLRGTIDSAHKNAEHIRKALKDSFKETKGDSDCILISDSREGWVDALKLTLRAAMEAKDVSFDFSLVRAEGEPIRTFGGIAAGPGPLGHMLKEVYTIIRSAAGRKLTTVEGLDITNHVGLCVKSGNVRRSALLQSSVPEDQDFRNAKKDLAAIISHRHTSNNSVAFHKFSQFENFDWRGLVEDNMIFGDPGIINLALARLTDPEVNGINPCQPADATVLTPQGIRTFAEIDVGSVIWSGKRWTKVVRKVCTGEKEVFRFQTTAGVFRGTSNHQIIQEGERVEAGDAESIDLCTGPAYPEALQFNKQAVIDGWVLGDGTVHKSSNNLVCLIIGKKDSVFFEEFPEFCIRDRAGIKEGYMEVQTSIQHYELPKTYERCVPDRFKFGDARTVVSFLRGLYAANGSVCGGRVTLKASSFQIICDVQEMLSSLGIPSYYTTNKPTEVEFSNGTYLCKQSYDLQISTGREDFMRLIGFVHQYKTEKLLESTRKLSGRRKNSFEIISRQSEGVQTVYDITVEAEEHTYWTGGLLVSNCGEIFLVDRESCNLCEFFPARAFDTQGLILISRYAFRQRLLSFTDERTEAARKRKMRVGVGLGGVCDLPSITASLLQSWYRTVRDTCDRYANDLGETRPIAVTTVKPSGSISLLSSSSPGMHAPYAEHFIRRIRIPKDSQIAEALTEANVPCEPEVYGNEKNTLVFSFPMKAKNAKLTVQNETIKDQFDRQLLLQKHWADNAVSATISFEKEKADEMAQLLGHYAPQLKSSSFLTKSHGYLQAPYEAIPKEKFEQLYAEIDHGARLVHGSDGEMDLSECAGGSCPIR